MLVEGAKASPCNEEDELFEQIDLFFDRGGGVGFLSGGSFVNGRVDVEAMGLEQDEKFEQRDAGCALVSQLPL